MIGIEKALMRRLERKITVLSLTGLFIFSALCVVPIKAVPAASPAEDTVAEILQREGLEIILRKTIYNLPVKLRSGNAPIAKDILNYFGGKEGMKGILEQWRVSPVDMKNIIEWYDSAVVCNRKIDILAKIPGLDTYYVLIEVKRADDVSYYFSTMREAFYDAYIAAKGEPVIWVVEKGVRGRGLHILDFVQKHGVKVVYVDKLTDLTNSEKETLRLTLRHALGEVYRKVWNIPLDEWVEKMETAVAQIIKTFREKPGLVIFIGYIGARMAVSLWTPRNQFEADCKQVLENALNIIPFSFEARSLMSIGLTIAGITGKVSVALSAISLIGDIFVTMYGAVFGPEKISTVRKVEQDFAGIRVRLIVLDPPNVWLPRTLIVIVNDQVIRKMMMDRWTNTISEPYFIPADSIALPGGKSLWIWYSRRTMAFILNYKETVSYARTLYCTVGLVKIYNYRWTVELWHVVQEITPPVSYTILSYPEIICSRPEATATSKGDGSRGGDSSNDIAPVTITKQRHHSVRRTHILSPPA
jgi:hypothetical protein